MYLFSYFIVFKGVNGYTEVTDTKEVNDSTKVDKEMSYLKDTEKTISLRSIVVRNKQILNTSKDLLVNLKDIILGLGQKLYWKKKINMDYSMQNLKC